MSLITRCPACGTMFKVVPDQLRISEGWVRCGHCTDVFDAAAQLQADPPEGAEPIAATLPTALPQDCVHADDFHSSLDTEIEEGRPSQAPDSAQFAAEAQALVEHPLDRPFELRRQDSGGLEEESQPRDSGRAKLESVAHASLDSRFDSQADPELQDLSFVRLAQKRAYWARPAVRVGASLAIVALGLLLAVQVAVHDRDRLAASEPAMRPWLAGLCEALGCRIGPAHQIEAIAIDGSAFNKLRTDAYRLNVTLKNQGPVAVAVPALELTLTDVQDQPLVRRVLMPAELGINASVIGAASERSVSLALAVTGNGAAARIAGYRLLAFYP